jgi:serine protease Do
MNTFFRIRSHRSLLAAAMAALFAGSMLAWAAAGTAGAKAPITVKADTTPLPRHEGGELSFAPIVKRVVPSVVKVETRVDARDVEVFGPRGRTPFDDPFFRRFFGPGGPEGGGRRLFRHPPQHGLGSGVIVSADGYIVTNNHVVDEADKVSVTLSDGRKFTATVVGNDKKTDIAVIKIDETNLPAITFADSDAVEVGDRVLAVGNPFGLDQTVTSGIVSATGRAGATGLDYEDFIQTDAAINPGNSGGALVDFHGRLIGINTAIFSRTGGFQGVGFAIPSSLARNIMESLVQFGSVTRGWLGVSITELASDVAAKLGLSEAAKGALVGDVVADGPAAKAGLRSYDVIVGFDGKDVTDTRQFRFAVAAVRPGTKVSVDVVRDGKKETLEITVGTMPGDKEALAGAGDGRTDEGVLNGVGVADLGPAARREFGIPARIEGAIVTDVEPDSAAAEHGLAPGDVILEINRQPVRSAEEAVRLTEKRGDGKTLVRVWSRGSVHLLLIDESERAEAGR